MARKRFNPGRHEADLTRRFRALRSEAVLLASGTAFLAGLTILATICASAAVREGMLLPSAVVLVGLIGAAAVLAKIKLDHADHSGDPALWRELLKERFDTAAATPDFEIRRLTSMVIDLSTRFATAEIHADDQGRSLVADTMPSLDGWIDSTARLAHRLAELRVEGRLQADLAATSHRRLSKIEVQRLAALDPDLRRQLVTTADGVRQQIRAEERFHTVADSALLRLEHAAAVTARASARNSGTSCSTGRYSTASPRPRSSSSAGAATTTSSAHIHRWAIAPRPRRWCSGRLRHPEPLRRPPRP